MSSILPHFFTDIKPFSRLAARGGDPPSQAGKKNRSPPVF